jgi:hypothetical protein
MTRKNRNKSIIKGWRNKLIFLLVVYFAGFATAVYCLAPVPQGTDNHSGEKGFANLTFKSEDFTMVFNEGLHKVIDFSKSAALRTADFIKEEYKQRKMQPNS